MAYIGRQQDGFGVRSRFIYTATGGQTTFNTDDSSNALSYSDGAYVDVYLNGVLLDPADYTATSLTSIVLDSGATASDILEVIVYDVFSVFSGTFTNGITANTATVTGDLTVDTNTLYVDSTNNRVGIGLTDPDTPLEVQIGSSGNALKLSSSTDGASVFLAFEQQESGTKHVRGRIRAASNGVNGGLIFETGASSSTSERIRLDNAGDFFVAKTSQNVDTVGHELRADGVTVHTANGACPLFLNRQSSDGAITVFQQAGSTDGQINSRSGQLSIGSSDTGLEFNNANDAVLPHDSANNQGRDNAIDLGSSSARYDDIYATNTSIIGTSDQNEKQQIASLTDAEIIAAKALSKLFKTFKWNDSVEAKGDSARKHTGHIAQEVQQAMTDAGLNAADYAFFCSDTWWETQTDVPAVEADEANGIEAKDAYTRTDVYNTAEEAPEGATERTRLGIRYPELLAFVGAATEQRLANIETRLTALESA